MAIGTMTSVKHNLKGDQSGLGAPMRGQPDTHLPPAHDGEEKTEANEVESDESSKQIEPPIKSATSSTIVCGGGCIAAAQRAAAGGCPGCECPADNCPCTKCGCPICGQSQKAKQPTPCCGGNEAGKRATEGNCPACGCPAGNCPCTNCKCPVCKSE